MLAIARQQSQQIVSIDIEETDSVDACNDNYQISLKITMKPVINSTLKILSCLQQNP